MTDTDREPGSGSEEQPEDLWETAAAEERQRPSLSERLMNLDPSQSRRGRVPASASPPANSTPASASPPANSAPASAPPPANSAPESPRTPPPNLPALEKPITPPVGNPVRPTATPRFTPSGVDDALDEARRYIKIRYVIFLTSLLAVFVLTVISGGVFVASLLDNSDWERTAISGGVAAFMVLILILLQYRPARSFGSAATQVAQLEATRASLNKSIEFWDRFLDERHQESRLEANDIAMAVTSMTTASRELMNAEVDLEVGPAKANPSGKNQGGQGNVPQTGNRAMPDPRRY